MLAITNSVFQDCELYERMEIEDSTRIREVRNTEKVLEIFGVFADKEKRVDGEGRSSARTRDVGTGRKNWEKI